MKAKQVSEPKYDVGDLVTTKRNVTISGSGSGPPGRKSFVLLAGTEWTVAEIYEDDPPSKKRRSYTLRAGGYKTRKREHQLVLLRDMARAC